MDRKVIINDLAIDARKFQIVAEDPRKIAFTFDVTHEEYHEVTTLLYQNDFLVKVPEEAIEFQATISNYSTSITNLYHEGEVGEFKLELVEKHDS